MAESSNRFTPLDKNPLKKISSKNQNKKSFNEAKYAMSVTDDKEFYQARKCLEAQSKRLKKGKAKETNQTQLKR